MLTPSSPESRTQSEWVRGLDAPDDRAVTPAVTRSRPRLLLGEGPLRWAAGVGGRMAEAARPDDCSTTELDALQRACAAAAADTLIAIVTGDPAALTRGTEPRLLTHYFLRRGLSVDHLIKTAEIYQTRLAEELSQAGDGVSVGRTPAHRLLLSRAQAAYQRFLTTTWAVEYERWIQTEPGHRLHLVRKLLADPSPRAEEVAWIESELAYPLERQHVSAVLRVTDGRTGIDLPALAEQLATASGCAGSPLVLARGHAGADVWFPDPQHDPAARDAESDWPATVIIGFGEPGGALEGFRSSHRQGEVELLAVLTAEPELAVALARRRLGPLAEDDVRLARLRETLTVYHAQGTRIGETAAALHTHRNTISYRLRQIEELLPRDHEGAGLRAALLLAAELPRRVLTAEGFPPRE